MMKSVRTWDEVFTRRKKAPNLIFLILYWYLFNKPDFQSRITDNLRKLKDKDEFKIIPDSIITERNITAYIHEMEKYNLVGIKESKGRRDYYQVLPFFYLDPFCIETPRLRASTIEEHYIEYESCMLQLGMDRCSDDRLEFNVNTRNTVIPAQDIIRELSSDLDRLLKHMFRRKIDYLTLYDSIVLTFRDLRFFFDLSLISRLDFEILDRKKSEKMYSSEDFDIVSLTEEFYLTSAEIEELSKLNQRDWETHMMRYTDAFSSLPANLIAHIENKIIPVYERLHSGQISFDREALAFK
jgi:hypothetical protein